MRYFRPGDRGKIRDIAVSTASGLDLSARGLVADMLTDYYIIYEPEHLLVAEFEGKIVGYLLGCFNTARSRRIKACRVIPRAVFKAILKGEVGRKEMKYLVLFLCLTVRSNYKSHPPAGYPAHFHINVTKRARGLVVGSTLVEKFFALLKEAGIPGVHVRIRENDQRARAFFQKFGFSRQSGYPTLIAEKGKIRTSRTVIYAKEL